MRCRWAGSSPRWRPATGLGGLTRAGPSQLNLLDPSDLEAETERMSFFLWTSEKNVFFEYIRKMAFWVQLHWGFYFPFLG